MRIGESRGEYRDKPLDCNSEMDENDQYLCSSYPCSPDQSCEFIRYRPQDRACFVTPRRYLDPKAVVSAHNSDLAASKCRQSIPFSSFSSHSF